MTPNVRNFSLTKEFYTRLIALKRNAVYQVACMLFVCNTQRLYKQNSYSSVFLTSRTVSLYDWKKYFCYTFSNFISTVLIMANLLSHLCMVLGRLKSPILSWTVKSYLYNKLPIDMTFYFILLFIWCLTLYVPLTGKNISFARSLDSRV